MVLIPYAIAFYVFIIRRSLQISHGICLLNYFDFLCVFMLFTITINSTQFVSDHFSKLYGLRPGWLFSPQSLNVIKPYSLSFAFQRLMFLLGLIINYYLCIPFQDVSDAQWRNFRSNLPILTVVFILFAVLANTFRTFFNLKARGMSILWLFISFIYLFYLHGAWYVFFIISFTILFIYLLAFAEPVLLLSFMQRYIYPLNCFP